MVKDRTSVDTELASPPAALDYHRFVLREGTLAIVAKDDLMHHLCDRMLPHLPVFDQHVCRLFVNEFVTPNALQTDMARSELRSFIQKHTSVLAPQTAHGSRKRKHDESASAIEQNVERCLVTHHFLLQHASNPHRLAFTIPGAGLLLSQLEVGRAALMRQFKGRPGALALSDRDIHSRLDRIDACQLGPAFLLADAEGSNRVVKKQSGMGVVWVLDT